MKKMKLPIPKYIVITQFKGKFITFLTLLTIFSYTSSSAQRVDSLRAEWITSHLVNLDQLLNQESGSSNIAELTAVLEKYRVVSFGEPTHGDGTAFRLRNRLTERLIVDAGFSVLGLESLGMFNDPLSMLDEKLAWMWTGSEQARAGINTFVSRMEKEIGFSITGFDVQHSNIDSLFIEIGKDLEATGASLEQWPVVKRVLKAKFRHPFSPVGRDTLEQVLDESNAFISTLEDGGSMESAWLLKNARSNALVPFKRSMQPRDTQMGENLVYLVNQPYEGQKMVAWGAGSHLVKSLSAIDNLNPKYSYDNADPMGKIISENLKDDYYVIVFSACSGRYGASHISLDEKEIKPPTPGSLEDLVCRSDFGDAAFLDLRSLSKTAGGEWLNAPLVARPLGYSDMRASWPLVVDGMIVIREMEPSRSVR